jgi:hypothetical protein
LHRQCFIQSLFCPSSIKQKQTAFKRNPKHLAMIEVPWGWEIFPKAKVGGSIPSSTTHYPPGLPAEGIMKVPPYLLALLCLASHAGAYESRSVTAEAFADAPHVDMAAKPRWSTELKAGVALPLGNLSSYAQPGPVLSLDGLYQASSDFDLDVFLAGSSQAYSVAWGAQALNNLGLGLKLLYHLGEQNGVRWYAGAGLAAYYDQRSLEVVHQPVVGGVATYDPTPNSSFGLGVLGTLGGRYAFNPHLSLSAELNIISISLAGGTADTLLLAEPLAGLNYLF